MGVETEQILMKKLLLLAICLALALAMSGCALPGALLHRVLRNAGPAVTAPAAEPLDGASPGDDWGEAF